MKTFSMTDVGRRRKMNQDYIFTSENPVGSLPNLFVVADGMGGHNAGDYASRFAVEQTVAKLREVSYAAPWELIGGALQQVNDDLYALSNENPDLAGMGTTFVAATILENRMYVANVGDSRLYVVNDSITQITNDHSLVQEMVRMGEMDKEEARIHPDKNIITRAVGVTGELEIDFFEQDLKEGDRVLLCSDGLTNMIEDEEIRRIIFCQRDIAESVEKLVETANRNGGRDNISVIIIEPF